VKFVQRTHKKYNNYFTWTLRQWTEQIYTEYITQEIFIISLHELAQIQIQKLNAIDQGVCNSPIRW